MPITTVTLTGNVRDQIGNADLNKSRPKVWLIARDANGPIDRIADPDSNEERFGNAVPSSAIASDGTYTFTNLWPTNAATDPTGFYYEVFVDYALARGVGGRHGNGGRNTWSSGPFELTASAAMADLDLDTPAVSATWRSGFRDEMEAIRDEVVDLSGISTPDAVIANRINTPGSETALALSATIDAAIAPLAVDPIRVMETRGTTERETSLARARVEYEDNAAWTETWPNLTAWETLTGLTTNGGIVYRNTGSGDTGAAQRTLAGMATARARLVTTIKVVAGGTNDNMTLFGVTRNTTTDITQLVSSGMFGIGVKENGVPWSWPANAALGPALPTGTYSIVVELSDQGITLILHSDNGTIYYRVTDSRASYGQTPRAFVWTTDSRGTSGNGIGPVGARIGYVSPKPALATPRKRWQHHIVPPSLTQFAIIGTPAGYDSRKPTPWVIYCHGYGDVGETPVLSQDTTLLPVLDGLLDAGFGVVSADFGGASTWGNNGALNAVVEVYQHLRDSYNVGPIVLMGNSMGGLTSLNTLARRVVPGVVGWIGFEPVVSLRNMYDHPTVAEYATAIKAAYGIAPDGSDYATKTDSHDPALLPGSAFRGVPMLLIASPGDTAVTKVANADVLADNVTPYQPDVTEITASGGHMDPSHFNVAAVVSFVQRVSKSG